MIRVKGFHRQYRGDALAFVEIQQVHQGPTSTGALSSLKKIDFLPVHLAGIGKEQQGVVTIGDQHVFDKIIFPNRHAALANTAARLRPVLVGQLTLGIAAMRDGHHEVLNGNQVFVGEIFVVVLDNCAALVSVGVAHLQEFFPHHFRETPLGCQNGLKLRDFIEHLLIGLHEVFHLKCGKPMQPQFQY